MAAKPSVVGHLDQDGCQLSVVGHLDQGRIAEGKCFWL